MQSQKTGERTGSRPSAAEGGGAPAPALRPADHRSTSTQLLPGDRLVATVASEKLASQKLDASIGASGPHDFAVRLTRCSSIAPLRPPHPIRVRDDRDTPLVWDGMAKDKPVIWVEGKAGYFFQGGWTAKSLIGQIRRVGTQTRSELAIRVRASPA